MTSCLTRNEHVASHQHVMLTKHSFPTQAFAYPVRKRLTKKSPNPFVHDCAGEALDKTAAVPATPPEVCGNNMSEMAICQDYLTVQFVLKSICSSSFCQYGFESPHPSSSYRVLRGRSQLRRKALFVVAGLRVQHEDKPILVPFVMPVENTVWTCCFARSLQVFARSLQVY